jgi:hypothetical protein
MLRILSRLPAFEIVVGVREFGPGCLGGRLVEVSPRELLDEHSLTANRRAVGVSSGSKIDSQWRARNPGEPWEEPFGCASQRKIRAYGSPLLIGWCTLLDHTRKS